MYNIVEGYIEIIDTKTFLITYEKVGLQVFYKWKRKKGIFFIYPYLDQNIHTFLYFCFEEISQKDFFEKLLKIPGIGPKTAFNIASLPKNQLEEIINTNNVKFLTQIPGIGPKTAKRIIVELKDQLTKIDLDTNNEIVKKIVETLKNLWYDSQSIKKLLAKCPISLENKNIEKIIKRLLDNM
jgi:Holliday junction DNA helicase RuvA